MANITPPSKELLSRHEHRVWHEVFDPHFETMVAWGYIDGAYPLSYGATCTGFSSTDGTVAFRDGAKLGYGAALSGDTVYIVSTSGSDTGTYLIQGIDANGDYATATVTATGTTPAAVSGTWNHIQRIISTSATNIGIVYISTDAAAIPSTVGDQIQVAMPAGDNYAINPELVCPNDQVITLNAFDFSVDVTQVSTVRIEANRQGVWIINFQFYVADQFEQKFDTPLRLFAGDRLRVSILAGGGTSAKASFGMNGNVLDATALDARLAGVGEVVQ